MSNRRAIVVVKKYGDPEIGHAIEDGISRSARRQYRERNDELERLRGELIVMRAREARNGVHAFGRNRSWAEKMAELPYKYGFPDEQEHTNKIVDAFVVGYALAVMTISAVYNELSARNRA